MSGTIAQQEEDVLRKKEKKRRAEMLYSKEFQGFPKSRSRPFCQAQGSLLLKAL